MSPSPLSSGSAFGPSPTRPAPALPDATSSGVPRRRRPTAATWFPSPTPIPPGLPKDRRIAARPSSPPRAAGSSRPSIPVITSPPAPISSRNSQTRSSPFPASRAARSGRRYSGRSARAGCATPAHPKATPFTCHRDAMRAVMERDYLSPVLSGLLFRDLFDTVVPISAIYPDSFERGNTLYRRLNAHLNEYLRRPTPDRDLDRGRPRGGDGPAQEPRSATASRATSPCRSCSSMQPTPIPGCGWSCRPIGPLLLCPSLARGLFKR